MPAARPWQTAMAAPRPARLASTPFFRSFPLFWSKLIVRPTRLWRERVVRACIQRVSRASVTVDGQIVGRIERGFVVLVAVAATDTPRDAEWVAQKIVDLRIFPDDEGKMNRSLSDIRGAVLVISQFTLMGDCRKGRRPSFVAAADPVLGERLYEAVVDHLRRAGVLVATGVFQQHMDVELVNDGPVTILLDSQKTF